MISVYTIEECNQIIEDGPSKEQIQKAKNKVIEYLQSKDIILTEPNHLNSMVHNSSTKAAKSWHYDDVSVINFIINIKGTGTKLLVDGKIEELTQGNGFMVIGEEGYTFLGLKPVLHCAPESDVDRLMLKIMFNPNFNLSDYVQGPNVCSFGSELYKLRTKEVESMLKSDLQIINKLN